MRADPDRVQRLREQRGVAVEDLVLQRQHGVDDCGGLLAKAMPGAAQRLKRATRRAAERLVQRPSLEGREPLRRERRILGRGRERGVQLGGALAEQRRVGQDGAERLGDRAGHGQLGPVDQRRVGDRVEGRVERELLDGPLERGDGVVPAVALVRDESGEHGDGRGLAGAWAVPQRPGEGRVVLEAPVEALTQLRLRVGTRLQVAEELEEQRVPVRDRGVALLGPQHPGVERALGAEQRTQGRPGHDLEHPALTPEHAPPPEQVEERGGDRARPERFVDRRRLVVTVVEAGDHPVRELLDELFGPAPTRHGQRQHVGGGAPVPQLHVGQHDERGLVA